MQQKFNQIIIVLRLQDEKNDDNNSIFKRQKIYNAKTIIQQKTLKSLTSIQALFKKLKQKS